MNTAMTAITSIFRKRPPRPLAPPTPLTPRDLQSDDEDVKYKPIEWPLIKRLLKSLLPYRRTYALGLLLGIAMTPGRVWRLCGQLCRKRSVRRN